MHRERWRKIMSTILSVVVVSSVVTGVAALGAGVAGADHPDDAPDLTEYADFKTVFPHTTDHYPGSMNEENGSIQYFASGADAFDHQDAEEGVYIDWIIVHANNRGEDWIDYSACDTENTEAFGIDRGNNNKGTQYDEDLVSRQEQVWFRDDGIIIDFFEFDDISNNPPYMAPEDAIVASQGAGSSAGACLTLTDEPGWYRIEAFMNGTVADNGPDAQPSEDADRVSLQLNANWLYVCECDSGQEARDELGPPPNETTTTPTETPGGDDPTPTATQTQGGDDPTPTETEGGDDPTPTATQTQGGGGNGQDTQTQGNDDGGDGSGDGGVAGTPTVDEAPGFGPVAALLALLASALLAIRRR